MKTYKGLAKKSATTAAIAERVREFILSILPGAHIILYGSRARGEAGRLSDLGLFDFGGFSGNQGPCAPNQGQTVRC